MRTIRLSDSEIWVIRSRIYPDFRYIYSQTCLTASHLSAYPVKVYSNELGSAHSHSHMTGPEVGPQNQKWSRAHLLSRAKFKDRGYRAGIKK